MLYLALFLYTLCIVIISYWDDLNRIIDTHIIPGEDPNKVVTNDMVEDLYVKANIFALVRTYVCVCT